MNCSRSTIRQLIAVAVCRGVLEQVPASFELAALPMPGHVKNLVLLAVLACGEIRADLESRNRIVTVDGIMQMERKTHQRYDLSYQAARAVFHQPNRTTMPASQALTGAMAIAAAMVDQAPDDERRETWNNLETQLTNLYQYYDPDMSDTEAMEQGVRHCEALMRITA